MASGRDVETSSPRLLHRTTTEQPQAKLALGFFVLFGTAWWADCLTKYHDWLTSRKTADYPTSRDSRQSDCPNLQIVGTLKGEEEERSDSGGTESTRDRVNRRRR